MEQFQHLKYLNLILYILYILALNNKLYMVSIEVSLIIDMNLGLFDEVDLKPNVSGFNLSIDRDTLSLIIDVDLEYLGYSYADDHTYGYGTTYVLDFEDFNAESDDIRLPGNCQNRLESSFIGKTFDEWWIYSETPYQNGHLGQDPYLSYPAMPDQWTLTIENNTCDPIHYNGIFSWYELIACSNNDGSILYNKIIENTNWVNLTGVFYINIVSPLQRTIDSGYYRVYQSLSAPFIIAVRKQVNIISSVGIDLFVMSIIAVYKSDAESDWRLIVLTESADFLQLHSPNLITSPTIIQDGITYNLPFQIKNESLNTGCLSSGFLCLQIWEIYVNNITCPPTNFSGTYNLQFDIGCNPSAGILYNNSEDLCNDYITEYAASGVTLSADLEWLDEICDAAIFIVQFDAEMNFYTNSSYLVELGDGDQYQFGDIAYIEIIVGNSNAFNIVDLDLDNVWICTTSPDNEPLTIDSQNIGTGGCISGDLDPGYPRHLVISGVENDNTETGNVTMYTPFQNNTVRFSFPIDSSIERANLYIQAQISLDITPATTTTTGVRRRALLQIDNVDTATQNRHFSGSIGITEAPLEESDNNENDENIDTDNEIIQTVQNTQQQLPDYAIIIISIIITSIICLSCFALIGICYKRKKQKQAKQEMDSVSVH